MMGVVDAAVSERLRFRRGVEEEVELELEAGREECVVDVERDGTMVGWTG